LTKLESFTLAWMLTITQNSPWIKLPPFWSSHPMFTHRLPIFGNTSLLWSHILPLCNKISKKVQNKRSPRELEVLANIAQREMLNTREKPAWTMIHMHDINEDTTCANN
jgi:hypothetical protein